ncbi:SEC12-like protein 2 [Lycium ferocissimum]|uniref:SEC12-like protein 2 n=1 Tax=Lycium ferocissimum TaxID=112874 RepID=UPI002816559B|nr:SEC12-like protein 2 [Lycium ferocissimum]
MAVHPGGEGLICSLPKTCRWFDWDFQRDENRSLGLISSERVLEPLQDVGQQLALTFNNEGSLLAVGGEVDIFPYKLFQAEMKVWLLLSIEGKLFN